MKDVEVVRGKSYDRPEVEIYGDIETLTQATGGSTVDVIVLGGPPPGNITVNVPGSGAFAIR
jgi:hypothetical protein